MIYIARLDTFAKIITIVTTILFGGIIAKIITSTKSPLSTIDYLFCILLTLVFLLCYLLRPIEYEVTQNELIIRRVMNTITIERSEIELITLLDHNQLSWSIRTFGNGGLWGYYGKYYNSKIGHMNWYVTTRKNAILIKTKQGKNIIISPEQATEFVNSFIENKH